MIFALGKKKSLRINKKTRRMEITITPGKHGWKEFKEKKQKKKK